MEEQASKRDDPSALALPLSEAPSTELTVSVPHRGATEWPLAGRPGPVWGGARMHRTQTEHDMADNSWRNYFATTRCAWC